MVGQTNALDMGRDFGSIFVYGTSSTDIVTATYDGYTYSSSGYTTLEYSILPEGYTEVEYIQNSEDEYINTGIIPDSTFRFELNIMPLEDISSTPLEIAGEYHNDFDTRGYFSFEYHTIVYEHGFIRLGNSISVDAGLTKNTLCQISYDGQSIITPMSTTAVTLTTNEQLESLYLFRRNCDGSVESNSGVALKFYTSKIWSGSTLLREFVPCKTALGEVGLYDLVNDVFYGNLGNGAFIAGNKVTRTRSGHLIKRLRDLGVYTVSVYDGTQTTTDTVTVSEYKRYDININN